jgi:DNA (cytosine-5)-methyltransferase 1
MPTHPDPTTWQTLRQATEGISTHTALAYSPKLLRFFRMLKAGQNWRHLPIEVQREAMGAALDQSGGKSRYYGRLSYDKPTPTLLTSPTQRATGFCHPEEDRPLSIEEYKRLQQFPDDWHFCGSFADQYRQIGNAVPVGLGTAIGHALQHGLD